RHQRRGRPLHHRARAGRQLRAAGLARVLRGQDREGDGGGGQDGHRGLHLRRREGHAGLGRGLAVSGRPARARGSEVALRRPVAVEHVPAWRDLLALVKPQITLFNLVTALGGLALAPGDPSDAPWVALAIGTVLIVGAANALYMYLERDIDCLMARTRRRPLPSGRIDPSVALAFGVALAVLAVPILTFLVHPLTGLLGVVAFLSYVCL